MVKTMGNPNIWYNMVKANRFPVDIDGFSLNLKYLNHSDGNGDDWGSPMT